MGVLSPSPSQGICQPGPSRMQPLCVSDQRSCMRATANPSAQHAVRQLPGRGAGGTGRCQGPPRIPPHPLTCRTNCAIDGCFWSPPCRAARLWSRRCGSLQLSLLSLPSSPLPLDIPGTLCRTGWLQSQVDKSSTLLSGPCLQSGR